jgi:hypothetical protein
MIRNQKWALGIFYILCVLCAFVVSLFPTVDDVVAKRFKEALTAAKNLWGAGAEA